jgi:hypothetical protein
MVALFKILLSSVEFITHLQLVKHMIKVTKAIIYFLTPNYMLLACISKLQKNCSSLIFFNFIYEYFLSKHVTQQLLILIKVKDIFSTCSLKILFFGTLVSFCFTDST